MNAIRALAGILLAGALLSGCGTTQRIGAAVQVGAEVNDQALVAGEFVICQAASVGSVLRRYGASREQMDAWRRLCASREADVFGTTLPPAAQ